MKELFEDIAAFFNDGVKLNGGQEEALPASPRSDAIEDTGCPFIFRFPKRTSHCHLPYRCLQKMDRQSSRN